MALKIQEGFQSDFIYSIRNKSKLGIPAPAINTNRTVANLGGAFRPVPLVPHGLEKEPVPHPDGDECSCPDVGPTGFVFVEFADSPYALGITNEIISVDASGGLTIITLPPAGSVTAGEAFHIKKIDATANAVRIDAQGADLIDGASFYDILSQWTSVMVIRTNDDGVDEWQIH